MNYYTDYEALEFSTSRALQMKIFPYYLDPGKSETALCPIFFAAANEKGTIVYSRNVLDSKISFVDFINNIIKKQYNSEDRNIFVWFHNVKYDTRIVLHELFHCGFEHIFDSEQIKYLTAVKTESQKGFSIIGENLTRYIGLNIHYRGFKICVRDSMSIINSAQNKILEAFGLEAKVEIDWNKVTIDNLVYKMPLIRERCLYDCSSIAKCIEKFKLTFKSKFSGKGNTAAGMSLDAYKHYLCVHEKTETIDYDIKNDVFRKFYPILNEKVRYLSKAAYSGGLAIINPIYAGEVLFIVDMVDRRSSYPDSMTKPLPYGEAHEVNNFDCFEYQENVIYIEFNFNSIPFQRCHSENRARVILGLEPKNKIYTKSQYPSKFKGFLCLNSIDINCLKKYANITELQFYTGYGYNCSEIMKNFIEPIYFEKSQSKGVLKMAHKILLNSLYGKFSQDLGGEVYLYKDIETFEKLDAIDLNPLYMPVASAITALSRREWVDVCYTLGDDFIYGDTDSAFYRNPDKNNELLEKLGYLRVDEILGSWGHEKEYGEYIRKGKFLSKKNYMLELFDHSEKLTCVGLSKNYHKQVTFENFEINSQPFNIQKMVNIYGGKAMRNTEFKIKKRDLY